MVKLLNQTPTSKKQIISTSVAPCTYFKFTNPVPTTSNFAFGVLLYVSL